MVTMEKETYTLEELCVYPHEFEGIDGFSNEPDEAIKTNLLKLKNYLDKSLKTIPKQRILSGYRDFGLDAFYCGIETPSNHIYGTCVDIEYKRSSYKKLIQVFGKLKETDIIKRYAGNGFKWLHIEIALNGTGRHIINT